MAERLDCLMTRSYTHGGETKTAYTRIGVAFPLQGGGYRLKLEAVPVPSIYEGRVECSMLLVPPRDDNGSQASARPQSGGNDDGIPF